MKFKALKTFDSEETRSTYVAGLSYTIRPGNDLLADLVKKWLEDGLIEYVDDSPAPLSFAAGQGAVKWQ